MGFYYAATPTELTACRGSDVVVVGGGVVVVFEQLVRHSGGLRGPYRRRHGRGRLDAFSSMNPT